MFKQSNDTQARTLDRGLEIIEFLSRRGSSSLAELRKATGLTNATLYRLLATLQTRGWVRRNLVEGQYELAHSLGNLLGETARAHPLAQHAAPILLGLKAREAGLPSDVSTVVGPGRMEIVESTRLRGPMAPGRTSLGIRPPMLFSAHGRAVLAFGSDAERETHLSAIYANGAADERHAIDSGETQHILEETRAHGFAQRRRDFWVAPFDPGPELGAIAVPIEGQTGIYGTVSILWIYDDMSLSELLSFSFLDDLKGAAKLVATAMENYGLDAPRVASA